MEKKSSSQNLTICNLVIFPPALSEGRRFLLHRPSICYNLLCQILAILDRIALATVARFSVSSKNSERSTRSAASDSKGGRELQTLKPQVRRGWSRFSQGAQEEGCLDALECGRED